MIEVNPYFAPGERYPSIIGVKADGDEHELAYIRKVEAERTCHMEWVPEFPGTDSPFMCWQCDVCGRTNEEARKPNYCPYCGARVEVAEQ